ncbi:MAG TPA: hypothetical protein VGK74_12690 [Symbiobacteriaceae bacterium]|jgi:hypothetical protein
MNERITENLKPFFERIQGRRGLRKWINQALKRRPELSDLLRETVRLLTDLEALYGFDRAALLHGEPAYHTPVSARRSLPISSKR